MKKGNLLIHYNRIARISGAFMAGIYAVSGGLLLFYRDFMANFNGNKRFLLGGLLFLYGIYRIVRSLIKNEQNGNEK